MYFRRYLNYFGVHSEVNFEEVINNMVEIYINTSIEECERRDVKGLYKKARKGEIKNMTGISAPYESPLHPDIQINTEKVTLVDATKQIINFITPKLILQNE